MGILSYLILFIILLFFFYVVYVNNLYLSYKLYYDKKFNDYDKGMLKTTSITQSIIFVFTILYYIYIIYKNVNFREYILKNIKQTKMIYYVIMQTMLMAYYGYTLFINYNLFNNNYDLDNLNDEKNKDLKYYIYLSIPSLLIIILSYFLIYR